jgi:uracil-DNA glycosylase family 4
MRGFYTKPEACARCPLATRGRASQPVLGIGSDHPKFILVGEGPGKWEVIRGEPFVGRSGELLNAALAKVGVAREDVFLTNATLCQPNYMVEKDEAVAAALLRCRRRLLRELKALPGAPIVALGRFAAQTFLGDKFKITELAGSYHKVQVGQIGEREVIPTVHPAAILRGGDGTTSESHAPDLLFWGLVYDLAKAARLADGNAIVFSPDFKIEYQDPARAYRLLRQFRKDMLKERRFALDWETDKVAPEDCTICKNCQGHDGTEAYYVPIKAVGLATEDYAISLSWKILTPKAKEIVKELLGDRRNSVTIHNRLFDRVVSARHGMPIDAQVHCTMLLHHNAFPGMRHKLERVGTQFMCIPPWKSEYRHGFGTPEELHTYNSKDALVTARVEPTLQLCVTQSKSRDTYMMDLHMAQVAEQMYQWGIPISRKVNRAFRRYFHPLMAAAKSELLRRLDDSTFKDRFLDTLAAEQAKRIRQGESEDFDERYVDRIVGPQVAAYLVTCGIPLYQVTKKGLLSTRKEIIESWASSYAEARQVLNFRKLSKLESTFVRPMPGLLDKHGRLHVNWSVNKITGRWGSSPNFQNFSKGNTIWPKDLPKGDRTFERWLTLSVEQQRVPNLRWQVVAPPGYVFVGADAKQLEARCIGLLSGDPYLCGAFLRGVDIHTEFAVELFPEFLKLPVDERERVRDYVKRAEYGYLYGAGKDTVYETLTKEGLDCSRADIHRMFTTFNKRMPRVAAWHTELFREVLETNELRALGGRRRCFPTGNAETTVIKNFKPQASGAHVMNTAMWRFWQVRPAHCYIIQQGHDAMVVECREDDTDKVKALVANAMTQEYTVNGITMQFVPDLKVGKSWAAV